MPRSSAGLLMYRSQSGEGVNVFLVHPGGPYWKNKDRGAWTIPKGEAQEGEDFLEAARREFFEETGFPASGPFLDLGHVKQAGAKVVAAWAFAGDCDPAALKSNVCEIEWPPRSGKRLAVPEVDRGAWFTLGEAAESLNPAQAAFLQRLQVQLSLHDAPLSGTDTTLPKPVNED